MTQDFTVMLHIASTHSSIHIHRQSDKKYTKPMRMTVSEITSSAFEVITVNIST